MESRKEEVSRGGRTEVQLGRQRAGELKIREGREIEVTGCVYGGGALLLLKVHMNVDLS